MNRKQFIESHGATCKNWNWSWSFINEKEKTIIFGAWDFGSSGDKDLIFSTTWQTDDFGNKNKGYGQSLIHINLILEEGYRLKIFRICYSGDKKNIDGLGPARISDFDRKLEDRILGVIDSNYYAYAPIENNDKFAEEIEESSQYIEGFTKEITVNAYERSSEAREECLSIYGYKCQVCEMNFEQIYGELGKGFIHVHHRKPLHTIKSEYKINPITDLIPLCPNCHAMIHRTKEHLSVETLRGIIERNKE